MASQRENVEQLFEAALQLEPRDRPAFIEQTCAGDPEVKHLLQELLSEDERAGSFLQHPLLQVHHDADSGPSETSDVTISRGITPAPLPEVRFAPGQVLHGRFKIVRFLARGGMGEVYEVEDSYLQGVHIALKIILPQIAADPVSQHRFQQEVLLARKVTHPALCPIYDIFHCDQPAPPFWFLTMKLLSGKTLSARLQRLDPIPREEGIAIFKQLTAGLAALHAGGVIHRDIKPNNVMLDGAGSALQVCITDFGLARLHESELTLHSKAAIAGTPGYMAPELKAGDPPSQATDIFALGVVLHQVFTGARPRRSGPNFSSATLEAAKAKGLPPLFASLIGDFLSEDPDRRCRAFEQAQSVLDISGPRTLFKYKAPSGWNRRQFIVAATATTAVAAAGGVLWRRDQLENLLHPLPLKRFVALVTWPLPSDSRIKPMLAGVIDAIATELARAEAFDRDLFVISHDIGSNITTPVQLNELRDSLGANLVLAASAHPQGNDLRLLLQVLDPSSTRTLREKQITTPVSEQMSLPDRAVHAAADLLNVSQYRRNKKPKPDTTSQEAYAAFQAAEALRKQDNDTGLEAAIEKYKQAVELDPRYALAHARLASAYGRLFALHRDPGALALCRANAKTALDIKPDLVDAHTAFVAYLDQAGDRKGSLQEISKALSLDPTNPQTILQQAYIYARFNQWAEAKEAFARLLKLRPNYWAAHNELGLLYNSVGEYSKALMEFRTASLAAPKNALALNNMGIMYLQLGNILEAKSSVRKSLALSPSGLAMAVLAATLRAEGNYAEAIESARKAVALDPADGNYWLELGDCYSLSPGHHREALDAYTRGAAAQQEILQIDPTNGPAWMLLALCQIKSGPRDTALNLIKKADSLFAADVGSQLNKARALELLGERDQALATVAACLKRGATRFQITQLLDMESLRKDPRYQQILNSSLSLAKPTLNPAIYGER